MGRAKEQRIEEQERGWSSPGDKYVCAKCFSDYALKRFVSENAVAKVCDYCGRQSRRAIAAPIDDVLEEINEGLRSQWGNVDNEGIPYESREGGYQGRVFDTYDIFHEIIDPFENDRLRDDIINAFFDLSGLWCKKDYYGLAPHEALRYGWEKFVRVIKHSRRYFFSVPEETKDQHYEEIPPEEFLNRLGEIVTEIGFVRELPEGTHIFRARVHDPKHILKSATELGTAPAEEACLSNRMSPAGIPMFYGTSDPATALAETYDPSQGPLVKITIGKFETARNFPVLDLTCAPEVPSIFDSGEIDNRPGIIFLHHFITDLSNPIEKDGLEHIEYVPTQVVTEFFRHVYIHPTYGKVLGILYNSSQKPGGECCVLFFQSDQCCQIQPGWKEEKEKYNDKPRWWLGLNRIRVHSPPKK